MCKSCQYCLESCYWHLIEKRFCYDEDIALYEVPAEKEEKNNNMFDNMAFYDCVSVIAGRSVVTIDPLPENKPIMQQPQPTRKLRWEEEFMNAKNREYLSKSDPVIFEPIISPGLPTVVEEKKVPNGKVEDTTDFPSKKVEIIAPNEEEKSITKENDKTETQTKPMETLKPEIPNPEIRRKSLRERRMSKSLYLKIDQPKELPLVRQQSMPKFYMDTPEADQPMFRTPSTVLTSPVPSNRGFVYDLYTVVQVERERAQNLSHLQHSSSSHAVSSEKGSRLALIKEKIKLRRVKSVLGSSPTNLPHSHHHM